MRILDAIAQLIEKWACKHKYKMDQEIDIDGGGGYKYSKYHYVCSECGKMKWTKSN